MSKFKKAILTPHLFLRDLLNKRFPLQYSELKCSRAEILNINKILGDIEEIDSKFNVDFPVDIVYTWVDNSDQNWRTKFKYFAKNKFKANAIGGVDPARFECHNELFYSINSVLKNLSWFNKIFIVTDDQIPNWLNSLPETFREKIRIVDHTEIITKEFLPTFNSHVIEANLYKIKGLSENFIYFNDDVFVGRNLNRSHFFKSNGNASLFVTNKFLQSNSIQRNTATAFAIRNCNSLLGKYYSQTPLYRLQHTYMPLKKSVFSLAFERFNSELTEFQKNKFRSENDFNIATFLVPWMMYFEGKSQLSRDICMYFNWRSNDGKAQMDFLIKNKKNGFLPDSICANDFVKTNNENNIFLQEFMKEYFI